MNKYNINVDFSKGIISTNLRKLVQNDYNTTKLNFTFDKEGRVLFKMLYPDGTQYVDEIKNNELIFSKGVLNQEGTYEYEIALYTEDGRLTDYAVKSFEVRNEIVDTDELVEPDDRVPILDNLINEVETIKQDVADGKYNGKDGQDGVTPTIGENGNWYIGDTDTGLPSQGPEGKPGPAGGVSLEEVKAITGELENLGTEDKSNLVNAINEVMNNSGETDYAIFTNYKDRGVDSTYKINYFQKVIDAMKDDKEIILTTECENGISNDGSNIYTSPTITDISTYNGSVIFQSQVDNLVKNESGSLYFIKRRTYISVNVENGVVTSVGYIANNDSRNGLVDVLTKTNTTTYTPTTDYHPATKIYVDNAITTAITTTLEGSY